MCFNSQFALPYENIYSKLNSISGKKIASGSSFNRETGELEAKNTLVINKEKAELSGVYYLAVPHRSGDIQFRRNLKSGSEEWSASSKSGKLILFDSKLEHSVTENNSDSNRISLAFNLYTLPLEFDISSNTYSTNKFYS